MKKLTSTILAAVSAVLLACAFSACDNPNGGSGGNNDTPVDPITPPPVAITRFDVTYVGQFNTGASGSTYNMEFRPDGTIWSCDVNGTAPAEQCGQYTLTNNATELTGEGNLSSFEGVKNQNGTWRIVITMEFSAQDITFYISRRD